MQMNSNNNKARMKKTMREGQKIIWLRGVWTFQFQRWITKIERQKVGRVIRVILDTKKNNFNLNFKVFFWNTRPLLSMISGGIRNLYSFLLRAIPVVALPNRGAMRLCCFLAFPDEINWGPNSGCVYWSWSETMVVPGEVQNDQNKLQRSRAGHLHHW